MLVNRLSAKYFSEKWTKKDFDESTNLGYLTSLGGLVAGGAVSPFIGQYIANKKLKENLEKGEDFETAKKKAKKTSALLSAGLAGLSTLAATKLLKPNRSNLETALITAIGSGVAGGLGAWGTNIRAESLRKNKKK